MSHRDTTEPTARIDDGTPVMNRRRFLAAMGAGLTAGVAGCSGVTPIGSVRGAPPKRASSSNVVPIHHFVRTDGEPDGPFDPPPLAPKPDAGDLLEERRAGHPVDDGTDVDAVDGDLGQLTWKQFSAVEGYIDVTCVRKGTHVSLHMRNLVSKGLYTAWSVVFAEDENGRGFIDDRDLSVAIQNLDGFGPLGPSDGSENAFRASRSGEGQVTTIQPGGPLGVSGSIDSCALDESEWHVIVGLHLDGQTHGSHFDDPDNPGASVEQAGFVFTNGNPSG
jgi:hypothetical protein